MSSRHECIIHNVVAVVAKDECVNVCCQKVGEAGGRGEGGGRGRSPIGSSADPERSLGRDVKIWMADKITYGPLQAVRRIAEAPVWLTLSSEGGVGRPQHAASTTPLVELLDRSLGWEKVSLGSSVGRLGHRKQKRSRIERRCEHGRGKGG